MLVHSVSPLPSILPIGLPCSKQLRLEIKSFFFGSDSAPHPILAKAAGKKAAAGVFTQQAATQYVLDAIDEGIKDGVLNDSGVGLENIKAFLSVNGRRFYHSSNESNRRFVVKRREMSKEVESTLKKGDVEVYLFRDGNVGWDLDWIAS